MAEVAAGKHHDPMTRSWLHPRRSLFAKYFVALFAAVVASLLANGAIEAVLGYRDQRETLGQRPSSRGGLGSGEDRGLRRGDRGPARMAGPAALDR